MSQKYEKLKTLLRELFQLDQPDLDFGLADARTGSAPSPAARPTAVARLANLTPS